MANEKNYFGFIDLSDGSRWFAKDDEAQAAIANLPSTYATKTALANATLIPIDTNTLTPATTFLKNSVIGINGVMYKAKVDTDEFPVTLMVDGNAFVVDEIDGDISFVVEDDTLSDDWMVWSDFGIPHALKNIEQTFDATMEQHEATVAAELANKTTIAQVLSHKITIGGVKYTIQSLLEAVGQLMARTVVVNE